MPPAAITLTARYVFPVAGAPLAGGCVTIQGERIVEVAARPAGTSRDPATIDLGNVAILPGLVNAHTHLEFSHLESPLGEPGQPLPQWIRQVVASRRAAASDPAHAIDLGLAEAVRTGTTTLGEIATSGWIERTLTNAPCDLTVFYELIGLRAERVPERLEAAAEFVDRARTAQHWRGGLSPHAPYSVHPELVVGLIRLAAAAQLPVAMHLAESREELQLLADGSGPFRALLEALDAWDDTAIPHGSRPLEYLQLLAEAPRALVIHGNYLDDEELAFVALHPQRMSLVYCPRTHARFGHERYPLERLLALGASVALGTDSRASNPDLSMLAELRYLASAFPDLRPDAVLRLGTQAGAAALGRAAEAGTIEPGKLANLTIVALPEYTASDPHELLLGSALPVVAAWHRGAAITTGSS